MYTHDVVQSARGLSDPFERYLGVESTRTSTSLANRENLTDHQSLDINCAFARNVDQFVIYPQEGRT